MSKQPTGWRAWGLSTDADGPVLAAPEFGHALPGLISMIYPERTARAVCVRYGHKAPHDGCTCGLYSATTKDGCRVWLDAERIAVMGKVRLIGKTLEGSPLGVMRVWESSRGLIDAILDLDSSPEYRSAAVRLKGTQYLHPRHERHAAELSERYGVPFEAADWMVDTTTDVREGLAAFQTDMRNLLNGHCACGESHWGDRAAGLLLLNEERTHVVLQRRSIYVDHPKTWGLIGGAVEAGESPRKAALREAHEEARLRPKLLHVERTITPARPDCDKGWTYTYVVATTHWDGTDPILPGSATHEADGAAWCPLAVLDYPSQHFPLHPGLARDWLTIRAEVLS